MRKYLPYIAGKGYPMGKDIFYECTRCGDTIPSTPGEIIRCKCGNIYIDWDAARLEVQDHNHFKMFQTDDR